TVFRDHQPIGFYSHRGHAALVLAMTGVLALIAWQWRWLSAKKLVGILVPVVTALLLGRTRIAILAFLAATFYILGRKYYKLLVPAAFIVLLAIGMVTINRPIQGLPIVRQITSDRLYLWKVAARGIYLRPQLGWGFDGFGIAYPYVGKPELVAKVYVLGEFSFDYLGRDGKIGSLPIPSNKAHNLILDTTLSVGIWGMLVYLTLCGYSLHKIIQLRYRGLESAVIVYFIFTFLWFECAQYTHLIWWVFSLADTKIQNRKVRSNSVDPEAQ
ncbi:MAG: O-antigen polymerase, partial [Cyanobacteriota bacterium]|nr:O-antigen polymerase [Cyanobacteriota bacterium]